jgi:hypothetical protein
MGYDGIVRVRALHASRIRLNFEKMTVSWNKPCSSAAFTAQNEADEIGDDARTVMDAPEPLHDWEQP